MYIVVLLPRHKAVFVCYFICSLRRPARPRVPNGDVSVHTNFPSVISGSTEATIRLAGMLLRRIRRSRAMAYFMSTLTPRFKSITLSVLYADLLICLF